MRILHPTFQVLCLVAGAVRWAAVPRAAGSGAGRSGIR